MKYITLRKFGKLYHKLSDHIVSFDFTKTPQEIKKTIENMETIVTFPLLRLDEMENGKRQICLNEANPAYTELKMIITALDNLPEIVVRDLYDTYQEKCGKNITAKNLESVSEKQTIRNTIYVLLPEIIWCYGDDNIESKIF